MSLRFEKNRSVFKKLLSVNITLCLLSSAVCGGPGEAVWRSPSDGQCPSLGTGSNSHSKFSVNVAQLSLIYPPTFWDCSGRKDLVLSSLWHWCQLPQHPGMSRNSSRNIRNVRSQSCLQGGYKGTQIATQSEAWKLHLLAKNSGRKGALRVNLRTHTCKDESLSMLIPGKRGLVWQMHWLYFQYQSKRILPSLHLHCSISSFPQGIYRTELSYKAQRLV